MSVLGWWGTKNVLGEEVKVIEYSISMYCTVLVYLDPFIFSLHFSP